MSLTGTVSQEALFLHKLDKTLKKNEEFSAEAIVIGYFSDEFRTRKEKDKRVSMPDYAIDISKF